MQSARKNWRFCTQLAASACKICFHVALSSIVPAHFRNQISKGCQLNSQKHGRGCGLANDKKYNYECKDGLLHTSCLLVSCFVTEWPPVACKLYLSGCQLHANGTRVAASCMHISAEFNHVACDWRPRGYNLYATGRQSHANVACAGCQLHAKPPVFFQSRCENNYLN